MRDVDTIYSLRYNPSLARPTHDFLEFAETLMIDIDEEIALYEDLCDSLKFENEIYTEANSATAQQANSTKTNIFAKIGNAIIELFKKFGNWLKSFTGRVKKIDFENKSNTQKLEALIKKHPDLKNQILENMPNLNLNNIKSLSELEKEFDALMAYSDRLNESEFKRKSRQLMDKYDKKFENFNNRASTAIKVGASVAGLITITAGIKKAVNEVNETNAKDRQACNQIVKSISIEQQKAEEALRANSHDQRVNPDKFNLDNTSNFNSHGIVRTKLDIMRWKKAKTVSVLGNEFTLIERGVNCLASFLDRIFDKDSAKGNKFRQNSKIAATYGNVPRTGIKNPYDRNDNNGNNSNNR